ncbi:MAG: Polysaccharide biosynthesis protein [Candidatus Azambacteria bacterium GW2011_GWA1_44_9]|uniref:Polysaccharide biosynthesis protein n=1 Tax=Candidatus Azambacteria bacterium GW2011_GWA1_44_9 TaxID=1618610 RepID=A0A0G1N9C8_9BACT|nr:MAG: Polysaccharide biosynthesis protein [Candidatus Azambacteria bacterium GW2011_GWA1_44_9]
MVYLARGSFWSGSTFFVTAALSFGLTLAFANFLDKESYGVYKYIFSIYGLLGAFAFSDLNILIIQAVAKGNDGVLRRAFTYSLKWNIPYLIVAFGVAIYYYLNANPTLGIAFVVIALITPLTTSYNIYGSFLNGKKDFRLISISNAVSSVISAVATFFVIIYTQNPLLIVISYIVTNLATSALYYFYTIKKYQPNDQFEEGSLAMGKHFSLMNVFTIIAQNIDKILIFHFLGGASLAIYSFAQAPVNQMLGLLKLSGPIYAPKILAKSKEENKRELPKKFFQIIGVMTIPVIAYIIFAPYFYRIFFPQYIEAVVYSQFYALTLLTFGKKFIGIPTVIHLPKKTLYKLSIINPVIDILPKLILLYFFGLAGAIAAILLSNLMTTAVSFYYFKRM